MLLRISIRAVTLLFAMSACLPSFGSQWQVSGPKGGDLREVVVAGDDIWVADRNFLYVKRGGSDWERLTVVIDGRALHALEALTVDSRNPNRIAVGGVSYPSRRLTAISTDGGATWSYPRQLAELNPKEVTPVRFLGDAAGTLYVRIDSTGCQYFKGASWIPSPFEIAGLYRSSGDLREWDHVVQACTTDVTIDPATPESIYIQQSPTFGGNLVSRDGGVSWEQWDGLHPLELIADRHVSATRYGSAISLSGSLVITSPDGGHTWSPLGDGLRGALESPASITQQADGRVVAISREGLFMFSGSGWAPIEAPFRSGWDITAIEDGSRILAASERGLFETTTDAAWRRIETGNVSTEISSVATDPADATVVYASTSDLVSLHPGTVYRSEDRGLTWEELDRPGIPEDSPRVRLAVDGAGTLYALRPPTEGKGSAVYRLRKGASSWQELSMPGNRFIEARPAGETVYSMHHEQIVISTDGAETWSMVRPPSSRSFNDVVITGVDEEVIIGSRGDGVYRSIDRGEKWEQVLELNAWGVEAAVSDPSIIYVAGSTGSRSAMRAIYRSDDFGLSWTHAGDLPVARFPLSVAAGHISLIVDPVDARTVYVATEPSQSTAEGGWIYRSRDGGASWERYDDGLEPIGGVLAGIAVSADGSVVFAATDNGVRRLSTDPRPERRRGITRRP